MSWRTEIRANVNENEWRHVCFGSAPIEWPPQTLDNAIMETRPLPTKAIKPSACAWSNGKLPERTCTKTNFTLLKGAKLPAWHKTALITLDANQPTAFVFKLGVAADIALDLWNCITEANLPPDVTANNPITDNQQPFVLVDDIRSSCSKSAAVGAAADGASAPRSFHHPNTIVA